MDSHIVRAYHSDGTLAGGIITADQDQLQRLTISTLKRAGHVIIERRRPLVDSWNHRIAGVGQYHNDAEFAEQRAGAHS